MSQHEAWVAARARMGAPRNVAPKPIPVRRLSPFSPERNPPPAPTLVAPVALIGAPSWRTIVQLVALKHGTTFEAIVGRDRSLNVAFARHLALHLIRSHTELSLPQIGQRFDGRDHTTILSGISAYRSGNTWHQRQDWTPEKDAELIRRFNHNETIDQIATAFGKKRSAIGARLSRIGVPRRDGQPRAVWKS